MLFDRFFQRLSISMRLSSSGNDRARIGSMSNPFFGILNRNYVNLFESPVLFYFSCTILYLTDSVTRLTLWLAWAYFATRLAHSLVHMTANRVLYRSVLFGVDAVFLCGLLGQATQSILAR